MTPSTIDLLLTNTSLIISEFKTLDSELNSDHCPIFYEIEAATHREKEEKFFDYANAKWNDYKH